MSNGKVPFHRPINHFGAMMAFTTETKQTASQLQDEREKTPTAAPKVTPLADLDLTWRQSVAPSLEGNLKDSIRYSQSKDPAGITS
ncbi:hypothetical protein LTR10_018591 [Elasticomyces elasticus]|uniref:Uncharacterized protein n=1 Tax=Exophiala sideris TaxID=1016849 RepID=A0ABR0J0D7_9EURO|nr:hypothetical protein LTR10_018591 [Elasticomyces elasticus]KAK5023231.1 hypothetical protein LTS07_009453 [Exophiala sideris]KAK5028603.1 hypothetical protein LTR13_009054 [Exophiala sideris]KAK5052981.1 hypothetical protein LTR69_009550 [Exophiala sideris]KAK5178721.1 hypothetical protein LTR44_008835 [Eurotiomycetes sp. CCFEE 6388]